MNTRLNYLFKRKMMYTILLCSCILTTGLAGEVTYQAEDYGFSNDCLISTDYPGYNGVGFVDMGGFGSHFVLENVYAKDGEGKYEVSFRYASDDDNYRRCQIKVNDEHVGHLKFSDTGGWSTWETTNIWVDLIKGDNTISVTAETYHGGPNVDEIQVERIYRIEIQDGSSSAWGTSGSEYPIFADQAPEGQVFYKWKVTAGKVSIEDKDSPKTTMKIKKDDAVIAATYKDIPEMCYSACDTKTEKCNDIGVDECLRECTIDGDWSNAYVACMDRSETCKDVYACDKFLGCLTGGPVSQSFGETTPFSNDPDLPTMLFPDTTAVWTIDPNCRPLEQYVYFRESGTKKWTKGKHIEITGQWGPWVWLTELAYTLGPGAWDLKLVIAGDDYEPFYVKVPENLHCLEEGPNANLDDPPLPFSQDMTAPTEIHPDMMTWWKVKNECLPIDQTLMCKPFDAPGHPPTVNLTGQWGAWSWIANLADELGNGKFKCYLVIGDTIHGQYFVNHKEKE